MTTIGSLSRRTGSFTTTALSRDVAGIVNTTGSSTRRDRRHDGIVELLQQQRDRRHDGIIDTTASSSTTTETLTRHDGIVDDVVDNDRVIDDGKDATSHSGVEEWRDSFMLPPFLKWKFHSSRLDPMSRTQTHALSLRHVGVATACDSAFDCAHY